MMSLTQKDPAGRCGLKQNVLHVGTVQSKNFLQIPMVQQAFHERQENVYSLEDVSVRLNVEQIVKPRINVLHRFQKWFHLWQTVGQSFQHCAYLFSTGFLEHVFRCPVGKGKLVVKATWH